MHVKALDRDGYAVIADVLNPEERAVLRGGAQRLLDSPVTRGRDRGADGKDGFRGCVALDPDTFLPLISTPAVLRAVIDALSPNIHLMSSHLISLPSLPRREPRSIRTPQRPGWHRDMYGVTGDLGHANTPRLAVKCAFYLTDIAENCGLTMFLPASHTLHEPPHIANGAIDPEGARTPSIGECDGVLFENRTWHAGGINTSGQPRVAVMLQYGYRWLAPVDDPVPDLLADPRLSDVQRQLLGAPDRSADGSLAKGRGGQPLHRWYTQQRTPAASRRHGRPSVVVPKWSRSARRS